MIIWYGGREVIFDKMSIGELFAFMMYANLLANPINFIVTYVLSIQTTRVSLSRILELIDYPNEYLAYNLPKKKLYLLNGHLKKSCWDIEIKNLEFKYENGNVVFRDFSCFIPSNGLTLLFAPSGYGKSTLCKLLIRYFDRYKGSIKINGIEIKEIPVDYVRKNIIYLNQKQYIIHGTILDNLIYGARCKMDYTEIHDVIKSTSSNFIYELSEGLQSNFSQKNFDVSQGQAQRIALVRAILKKPKVLILDEPTSAVDNESENIIYQTLRMLKTNRCIILVSHNENAKKIADNIIEFKK